ncbi:undecaprenyl-diphosphatase [Rhodospirillum rubrum]|uniref:undecaprenyl-diphosphate phosphatase n=1 Tax=Rhodospirillum rubrum TaxID=1085 RepID=UPI00190657BC|nr:undecaprenyl-diphosphate phosphatase [Rhodospirillum rubrum]MBK1665011.1 undecaprenyl-diphosphatase [Rhodospirillum rubrum]MBK1677196.1 undecaprenyl-diphosphatase [Rhodospirillum rubrum]
MLLLQIVVLALIQGITEVLPLSSSGHLALLPLLTPWPSPTTWPDQGVALDVAVHLGTLGAVALYFWRDEAAMIGGCLRLLKGKRDPGARLAFLVVLGTLPAVATVLLLAHFAGPIASPGLATIGWTTLGFGLLLGVIDRLCMTVKRVEHMGGVDCLLIGLAQCLALLPGVSRSGVAMTAARLLGYERVESARFSMLLSIPAIAGAATLVGLDLARVGQSAMAPPALIAAVTAFVAAFLAVAAMMAWLRRHGFGPFVAYRVLLGAALLALAYLGPDLAPF